jgi:hypothetical protein
VEAPEYTGPMDKRRYFHEAIRHYGPGRTAGKTG